jgi:predicted DNA binding CopG/RHH family protein
MAKVDQKEKGILESVERGEWESIPRMRSERKRFQRYAEATFKNDHRINIRISGKDLIAIQKRALEEGIPYQTLISSLLHKYVSARLVDKERLPDRSG